MANQCEDDRSEWVEERPYAKERLEVPPRPGDRRPWRLDETAGARRRALVPEGLESVEVECLTEMNDVSGIE